MKKFRFRTGYENSYSTTKKQQNTTKQLKIFNGAHVEKMVSLVLEFGDNDIDKQN